MERPRGVTFVKTGGGRTSVRLGSIQRFLIRNLTRYSSSSRTGGTVQARAPLRSILSLWYNLYVSTHAIFLAVWKITLT